MQNTIFRTYLFQIDSFDSWTCPLEEAEKKKLQTSHHFQISKRNTEINKREREREKDGREGEREREKQKDNLQNKVCYVLYPPPILVDIHEYLGKHLLVNYSRIFANIGKANFGKAEIYSESKTICSMSVRICLMCK